MLPFLLYSIFAVLNLHSVSCNMYKPRLLPKIYEILKHIENELAPNYTMESYDDHFNCVKDCDRRKRIPATCAKAVRAQGCHDGVFLLSGGSYTKPFYVNCYQENYGRDVQHTWLVIQRRVRSEGTFHRNMSDYKLGFGNLHGSYWLGLERIREITAAKKHELWIRLEAYDGSITHASYTNFYLGYESELYTLHVDGYYGNAGDHLVDGNKFSSYDSDNDGSPWQCAMILGGGWWFGNGYHCGTSNLNGHYKSYSDRHGSGGIVWENTSYSYSFVQMSIRPV